MSTSIAPPPEQETRNAPRRHRSSFHQRLVDVERGVAAGIRRDSTLFVHFFIATAVLAGAVVLGLSLMQWCIVVLALTLVLTAEMFQQVLKTILESLGHHFPEASRRAERIGTAAVSITILGTVILIGLIFTERLMQLFSG